MPYTKVMIHFIWSTKNRQRIISKELKPLLLTHIKENSIAKGIFIDCLNCVEDHIHLLISLGTEQTIAKIAMLIKGESSFWVNKQKIIRGKFEWQDEYIALSVSESGIVRVCNYIANQEKHHQKKTFTKEYEAFLPAHGFSSAERRSPPILVRQKYGLSQSGADRTDFGLSQNIVSNNQSSPPPPRPEGRGN